MAAARKGAHSAARLFGVGVDPTADTRGTGRRRVVPPAAIADAAGSGERVLGAAPEKAGARGGPRDDRGVPIAAEPRYVVELDSS